MFKNYLKVVARHRSLYIFITFFYLAMGISRYAQLLLFQKHNNLINYSLSYSAMAIAGAFAFLIANNLTGWTLQKIVARTIPLYAFGMFLRLYTSSPMIAIISGAISGIGASITLLVIRTWLYSLSDQYPSDKDFLISARYTIVQVCSLVSTVLAGVLITLLSDSDQGYIINIVGSSLVMLLISRIDFPGNERIQEQKKGFIYLPNNKQLGILLYLSVLILGIASSLVEPIIAAILRDIGFKVATTTLLTSTFGLITILGSFFYQLPWITKIASKSFIINQTLLLLGIIGYLSVFTTKTGAILVFALSSFTIAGFFILKEIMEYDMFPKNETMIYIGLVQSAFLVGDAVGSPIGTSIYTKYGLNVLFILYAVAIVISTIAYSVLYRYMKNKIQ